MKLKQDAALHQNYRSRKQMISYCSERKRKKIQVFKQLTEREEGRKKTSSMTLRIHNVFVIIKL